MSFTKHRSPALLKFWTNLREVGTLISLSYVNETTPKQRDINECLSRASMLLLCSHVESFFEGLIVDILSFHENNQTPVSILPIPLKVTQILSKPLLDSLNPEKKWKILEEISQNLLTDENQKCKQGIFQEKLHLNGFASPGSSNVENLFKGIGISSIWSLVEQKAGNENSKIRLNVFVSRRNNITHGSSDDKPTIGDVRNYIRDMCLVVKIFNSIVTEYLINDFNVEDPWENTSR
ncbi:MAE_28990/MAE_18760 family HEPN-like nuclease [Chamaesiphon sp. VAR_48_metabat_135_sub]|uniref:MAE_28990/MAE_18760 family HEPN-like nuclease n=1 Tax=Chamaesiphon sp. VAR_48_metabat_135_sub TaxID=2964699 RepID=UPI00286C9A86|nr:MAE_28990/MAE_18760 family HEPN-like nuclease [Chamaesiphon sp. VAR_48_metabat_135_sub]